MLRASAGEILRVTRVTATAPVAFHGGMVGEDPAMTSVNPNKAGLALGAFFGCWHVIWAVLVATRWAQPLVDFVFWIHFIRPVYTVGAFHPGTALLLVSVTTATGYVFGYALGWLWNWVHR